MRGFVQSVTGGILSLKTYRYPEPLEIWRHGEEPWKNVQTAEIRGLNTPDGAMEDTVIWAPVSMSVGVVSLYLRVKNDITRTRGTMRNIRSGTWPRGSNRLAYGRKTPFLNMAKLQEPPLSGLFE